jgi:hypothetical protein
MQVFTFGSDDFQVTDEVARVLLELIAFAKEDNCSFEVELPIARAVDGDGRHVVQFRIEPSTEVHLRSVSAPVRVPDRRRGGKTRQAVGDRLNASDEG